MLTQLSRFMNLPAPVRMGMMVASGGGITAIGFWRPELLVIIFIGAAVVALVLYLYLRLLKWMKQRKAAPMEQGVLSTTKTPAGKREDMVRVDDLRKKFEAGVSKFRSAGKSLYSLPWYLIVGEPGSGKTEAVRHCNIGFPPGLHDQFQGVGGTINMNWWFTDHGVIVDTAGRLMFEEVETGGTREWREFLGLLKKYRPNCPINGVFLVIPADSLVKDTADEIQQKASKIARQFNAIQTTLDVRFPVFVVITKCDLVNGFREFFNGITDPEFQHQMFGWSNPSPIDEPYNSNFIKQHLKVIYERLFRRRLTLLQEQSDESQVEEKPSVASLYAFPKGLTQLAPRMARYLDLIFGSGSQWHKPLFFRGIYFTSSMQEGVALDEDLAKSLGVSVDSLPEGPAWRRDRAYFLRDLFMKKVFCEQGLVTRATSARKQHSRRRVAVLLSGILSIVLFLIFTFYSASTLSTSIGGLKEKLVKAEHSPPPVLEGGPAEPRWKKESCRFYKDFAKAVVEWDPDSIPWIFRWGRGYRELGGAHKALKIVYEREVLVPLCDLAGRFMKDMSRNLPRDWVMDSNELNALRQLVCLRAKKPFEEGDLYSAHTFLNPIFKLPFTDPTACKSWDKADSGQLHYPLDPNIALYPESTWPPKSLSEGLYLDKAIKKGVSLFVERWDPNNTQDGGVSTDYMQSLADAIADFNNAEEAIWALRERYQAKDHKVFDPFKTSWRGCFDKLKIAKDRIDGYKSRVGSLSLADFWNASMRMPDKFDKSSSYLLEAFEDIEDEDANYALSEPHEDLKKLRSRYTNLKDHALKDLFSIYDNDFWKMLEDSGVQKHLYEIRFEMYSKANEEVSRPGEVEVDFIDVSDRMNDLEKRIDSADIDIARLFNLEPQHAHFREADGSSRAHALSYARSCAAYNIVQIALESCPTSSRALQPLNYDASKVKGMLDAWCDFEKHVSPYKEFDNQYEDGTKVFRDYGVEYLLHHLEAGITPLLPTGTTWRIRHPQITNMDYVNVRKELKKVGENIDEAVDCVFKDPGKTAWPEEYDRFRQDLDGFTLKWDKYSRPFRDWEGLPADVLEARNELLGMDYVTISKYFPVQENPALESFVDYYWWELPYRNLEALVRSVEEKRKEEEQIVRLLIQKFPFNAYASDDLTVPELRVVRQWYTAPPSSESNSWTRIAEIDALLRRLKPAPPEVPRNVKDWLYRLPRGTDLYSAKLIIKKVALGGGRELSNDGIANVLQYVEVVQQGHSSGRKLINNEVPIAEVRYPGPEAGIALMFYESLTDPTPDRKNWTGRWACLRMLLDPNVKRYPLSGAPGVPERAWILAVPVKSHTFYVMLELDLLPFKGSGAISKR